MHAMVTLLAHCPDFRIVFVDNMDGWRWLVHDNTLYLRGDQPSGPAGSDIVRAVEHVLDERVDPESDIGIVVQFPTPQQRGLTSM
jgi:hypothetical protein